MSRWVNERLDHASECRHRLYTEMAACSTNRDSHAGFGGHSGRWRGGGSGGGVRGGSGGGVRGGRGGCSGDGTGHGSCWVGGCGDRGCGRRDSIRHVHVDQ